MVSLRTVFGNFNRSSFRLLMLLITFAVLLFMIMEMKYGIVENMGNLSHVIRVSQVSPINRPVLQPSDPSNVNISSYNMSSTIRKNEISKDGQEKYFQKSEKWYLSAISKLSYSKFETLASIKKDEYFNPNPKTRFEISDEEILSPPACSNETRIVVLILSEPKSLERAAIRQTWGSVASEKQWPWVDFKMDIQLLFVVGVKLPNVSMNSSESSTNTLENSQLKAEFETYKDILQLSTRDSYSNLTRKMISGFKWINKNCPKIQYVIKSDQDIFVNIPMLWQFLKHNGKNNSVYGFLYGGGHVNRKGRWKILKSELSISKYPLYASGTTYVISSDAIGKVLDTYYLFPYVKIEDAFITGIIATFTKIDRYHVEGFTHWEQKRENPGIFIMDRKFVGNRFKSKSLIETWNKIMKRMREWLIHPEQRFALLGPGEI